MAAVPGRAADDAVTSVRRAVLNLRDDRPVVAPPDDAIARITAAFPASDWTVTDVRAPVSGRGDGGGVSDEALAAVRDAEVWIGYGFPRELLDAALANGEQRLQLRWIHSAAAGVRSMLHPEIVASDVVITNSAGVHAEPIAESALGCILHFARGFDFAVRAQARAEWDKMPFESRAGAVREIAGATLGIIGYGGIGRALARRAVALGMHVQAQRTRESPDEDGVAMLYGDSGLEQLLRTSDYVVVSLPSTDDTHHLIDAEKLGWLKADAVLVNVGRGDVIDEHALTSVLQAGALRGAGLDVFEVEPLPAESVLWGLPNVLILPHVSATTTRFWERQTALIVENVGRYLRGERLRNEVEKDRGY